MQLALQLIVAFLKPLQGFPLAVHIGPLLEREHTPSMAKKREGEGERKHTAQIHAMHKRLRLKGTTDRGLTRKQRDGTYYSNGIHPINSNRAVRAEHTSYLAI